MKPSHYILGDSNSRNNRVIHTGDNSDLIRIANEVDVKTKGKGKEIGETHKQETPQGFTAPIADLSKLSRYIQVGINGLYGNPVLISPYEFEDSNHKNYEQAHRFLLEKGFYMPTPKIFMTHFCNVVNAYNGKLKLLYADGSKVSDKDIEDIYKHLTTNHKEIFKGGLAGAWTHLNAGFEKKNGECIIKTIMGIGKDSKLIENSSPLETCLISDCFAELNFNSQGLAIEKSGILDNKGNPIYKQGENIKFWFPRNGAVARFNAYSDGADLVCDGGPAVSGASLGVSACAEGAVATKNSGGQI